MIRTFMDVFLHAPWYGTSLMTILFAGILVQFWWWMYPIFENMKKKKKQKQEQKQEQKWLWRALATSVVFAIVFSYYYDQMPKITSQ